MMRATAAVSLVGVMLGLVACDGAGDEQEPAPGGMQMVLSTTAESAGFSESGEGTVRIEGEVSALGYAEQAERVAGYGEHSRGLVITDDDGESWALGYTLFLDTDDLATDPDVAVGDRVALTVRVEMPWGTNEGVMLEDDAGLVFGGVNGRMQSFGIDAHFGVADGDVVGGTFEHACGEGQRMELDVSADTPVSVATGESAAISAVGNALTFINLGTWQHQESPGVACLDWSPPYSWAAQR